MADIRELVARYPRSDGRHISALVLWKEQINQKRVRRLWRAHQLHVPRVRRRRLRSARLPQFQATYPWHIWAYDFVEDALADGTTLRMLTVTDAEHTLG